MLGMILSRSFLLYLGMPSSLVTLLFYAGAMYFLRRNPAGQLISSLVVSFVLLGYTKVVFLLLATFAVLQRSFFSLALILIFYFLPSAFCMMEEESKEEPNKLPHWTLTDPIPGRVLDKTG